MIHPILKKLDENIRIADAALEFYTDDAIYDPGIKELGDGTKITPQHWCKVALAALAEIRGEE